MNFLKKTSFSFLVCFFALVSWGQYVVDFEGAGETNTSYAAATVKLSGLDWQIGPEALIGTAGSDMKNGGRAARLSLNSGTFGSITMLEAKTGGIGTISFLYARSNFSEDRTGTAPSFVVEYSTNGGGNWSQVGSTTSLDGVDELTLFEEEVNVAGNVRVRMVQVGGASGKRWNVDDITITDYIPSIIFSDASLTNLNYIPGSGPSAEQTFTVQGFDLSDDITLTAPTNFEISTTAGSGFGNTITLSESGGTVSETTIYVRLEEGLAESVYSGDLTGTSSGVTTQTLQLSGEVSNVCGLETFTDIGGGTVSSYSERSWVGNGSISWTATDARIDQDVFPGDEAVLIRNGSLSAQGISGGIGELTLSTRYPFSDSPGDLSVFINGLFVGTIPYDETPQTTTISNIDIAGTFDIEIVAPGNDRVAMDNLTWTCYTPTGCEVPSGQASAIEFNDITQNQVDVDWTNGNGDGRIVVMNTANFFSNPENGSNPSANLTYSGSGEQVVFNGTGNGPVTIEGLTVSTEYFFRIFEYCESDRNYQTKIDTDNPNTVITVCPTANNYFRSISSGDWKAPVNWESSTDEVNWGPPVCFPRFTAETIRIRDGHTISLSEDLVVDQVIIEDGGVLRKESGAEMTLRNGPGDDLIIMDGGTLIYAGSNSPIYNDLDVRMRVASGGKIQVNNNVADLSSDLVGNGSSNRIIYEDAAIFEWNTGVTFATAGQEIFPNADESTIPVFRLSAEVNNLGAASNTLFNGVLEANENVSFSNTGDKIIRNGIVGTGNVTQNDGCGPFLITGERAFLGGSGSINLHNEGMQVIAGSMVELVSNKSVNNSELRIQDEATLDLANFTLTGSGDLMIESEATIITANSGGLDDALNGWNTIVYETPLLQNLVFNRVGSQNSGEVNMPLSCANLTLGDETILTLEEDLTVSNQLRFQAESILIMDDVKVLTISNADPNAINGANLVGEYNYIDGRLLWNTEIGSYDFPIGTDTYKAQGVSLTVNDGAGNVLAFLEPNLSPPLQARAYCDIETNTASGQQVGEGESGPNGVLDQFTFDLQSPLQWNITNPGGGVNEYDILVAANGGQDIIPVIAADGTPIRFLMKNGEPGNTGVTLTDGAPSFNETGFLACPNGYELTGLTSFSEFTIDGATPGNTALPVELVSFTAEVQDDKLVRLTWITESEVNNDFFTLEKSADGFVWETIADVKGAGNSSTELRYSYNDRNPFNGISYYRLKQTDFDGTYEYFDIQSVNINSEVKQLTHRVNTLGQIVDESYKGIVLLHYSDGTTVKVLQH